MAKLQFGRSMLASLANPNFGNIEGLGRQIGSAQAMAQDAERQKEFDANAFKLFRQGLFSVDEGDVAALSDSTSGLADLLANTRDEKDRVVLQDYITQLDAQRTATETKATTNTAESIIKTEQALEKLTSEMDTISGPLAPPQQKVFDALTQRLGVMKQNSKAVIEADTIKYNAEVDSITRDETLRGLRIDKAVRDLKNLPAGSKAREALETQLESQNLGEAIDFAVQSEQEAEQRERELMELRGRTGSLNAEEIQNAKDLGIWGKIESLPTATQRNLYNAAAEQDIKLRTDIALRPITVPNAARAKAIVLGELREIARQGDFTDLMPWYDDIATKIRGLGDEKVQELIDLTQGLSEIEVRQEVVNWLYDNYETEMQRSDQYRANINKEVELFDQLVQRMFIDDPKLNPDDEIDLAVARRRAERLRDDIKRGESSNMSGRSGAERRRQKGPSKVAEPYDVLGGKTSVGGQMNRRMNKP